MRPSPGYRSAALLLAGLFPFMYVGEAWDRCPHHDALPGQNTHEVVGHHTSPPGDQEADHGPCDCVDVCGPESLDSAPTSHAVSNPVRAGGPPFTLRLAYLGIPARRTPFMLPYSIGPPSV